MVDKQDKAFIDNVDPESVGAVFASMKRRVQNIREQQAAGALINTYTLTVDEMESILAVFDALNMTLFMYGDQITAMQRMIDSLIVVSPMGPVAAKIKESLSDAKQQG